MSNIQAFGIDIQKATRAMSSASSASPQSTVLAPRAITHAMPAIANHRMYAE